MKVRILKSCAGMGFSFQAGEVVDLTNPLLDDLISAGIAEPAEEKAVKEAEEKAVKKPAKKAVKKRGEER